MWGRGCAGLSVRLIPYARLSSGVCKYCSSGSQTKIVLTVDAGEECTVGAVYNIILYMLESDRLQGSGDGYLRKLADG